MHSNRRHGTGILLLAYHIFGTTGIDRIPPVTLAIIVLQAAIFLRIFKFPWNTLDVCISVYHVWHEKDWKRLLFGALEHADDWHLYYNMVSFILKGQRLERQFGAIRYMFLMLMFTLLTSATTVLLYYFAAEFYDVNYEYLCSVGFSGVIFALKVLTTYYHPNYQHYIMGIPVLLPALYVVWAELLMIQLFVPTASFLGHFAGILVGLAYVKGPLKTFTDNLLSFLTSVFLPSQRFPPRVAPSGFQDNRYSRFRPSVSPLRYDDYVPEGMSEEEQMREATRASLFENYRHGFEDFT